MQMYRFHTMVVNSTLCKGISKFHGLLWEENYLVSIHGRSISCMKHIIKNIRGLAPTPNRSNKRENKLSRRIFDLRELLIFSLPQLHDITGRTRFLYSLRVSCKYELVYKISLAYACIGYPSFIWVRHHYFRILIVWGVSLPLKDTSSSRSHKLYKKS